MLKKAGFLLSTMCVGMLGHAEEADNTVSVEVDNTVNQDVSVNVESEQDSVAVEVELGETTVSVESDANSNCEVSIECENSCDVSQGECDASQGECEVAQEESSNEEPCSELGQDNSSEQPESAESAV